MIKVLSIIILSLASIPTWSQIGYSKFYDYGDHSSEGIISLSEQDGAIYAMAASRCDSFTVDCTNLISKNYDGDVLWFKQMDWIDIGGLSLNQLANSVQISGHIFGSGTELLLHERGLNGDSLSSYEIPLPDSLYAFGTAGSIVYGEHTIIYGGTRIHDSPVVPGVAAWITETGELDSLMVFDQWNNWSVVSDMAIDPSGLLTVLIDHEEWTMGQVPFEIRRKRLEKYNSDMELIWSWSTSNDFPFSGTNVSRMEILVDGTMVLIAEDGSSFKEEIWGIDESGIKWRYSYPASNAVHQYIINLSEAANGDILGCGRLIDTGTFQGQNGYLFRMSPTGEMIWERAIIENRSGIEGDSNAGYFFDVIELPDGSILAGGLQYVTYLDDDGEPFEDIDAWLVRTDADGCIIEDCEYVQDFTTSIPVFSDVSRFEIFPNPAIDVLQLNWSAEAAISEVLIFNALGELVDRQYVNGLTAKELSIHSLAKGMYFVSLRDEAGRMYTEKVLVQF